MNYCLSSLTTNSDEAAKAPEVDGTVLAPEWRGDNTAPEVAPGHAMQVVVDDSPPEAMDVESSERPSDPLSNDAIIGPTSRKKRIILGLVVMGTMLAALGIGLGLGLPRHPRGGQDDVANTTGSDQGVGKSPHSLIDDTAICAITCSNGIRQVFFQEESGRLRRALYSSQPGVWKTSTDLQMIPYVSRNDTWVAKNATPLAAAVRRNIKDDNDNGAWTKFSYAR
ncbi:MAG: hypothetical protein L6R42_005494 [Xanthoria sp. 1 TBL-2021]|nr:MAG: hypothetical protein L6R42_005494 [Xanthoria sp. 1 TBL-2021]